MDIFKENVLRLKRPVAEGAFGHPWVRLADLNLADSVLVDGNAATLIAADGHVLGSGIFDRRNLAAAWRRFSWAEAVAFDESLALRHI